AASGAKRPAMRPFPSDRDGSGVPTVIVKDQGLPFRTKAPVMCKSLVEPAVGIGTTRNNIRDLRASYGGRETPREPWHESLQPTQCGRDGIRKLATASRRGCETD